MKRYSSAFFLLFLFFEIYAQQDHIYISAQLAENKKTITVNQEIVYHNISQKTLDKIKLLNWIAAYKTRDTPLLKRKLEDRNSALYFAESEHLGSLGDLMVQIDGSDWVKTPSSEENIYIPLGNPLPAGDALKINLKYQINLPDAKFTGYGTAVNKIALKYFFLTPDSFETEIPSFRYYLDIEENQSPGNFWKINLKVPAGLAVESNLPKISDHSFEGQLNKDPEFIIREANFDQITTQVNDQKITIEFSYLLTELERRNLEFFLPLQLHFIKNKIGFLPSKILITEKFNKDENFIGIDDINFWKFHYKLFKDEEKTDLNYFSILSKAIVQRAAIFEKSQDHWLTNGLKTYLEIQYIDRYYHDRKLLGDLPNELKIFGLKPLKFFHLSNLKLSERYGLGYQYMLTQNLDQKIKIPFEDLSNFNATAISHFETGNLFSFIAEKMGSEKFDDFLKSYLTNHEGKHIDQKEFLDELTLASGYSADFLEEFIAQKNRVNFKLKRFQKSGDQFQVKISKNTTQQIPFKLETETKTGEKQVFWFDTESSKNTVLYNIPQANADKIVVNSDYIFPEANFRDNYLYTKGLFANTKKIRLKVFKDIPNPEYNEIYVNPRLNFNAYDKVLFGVNFKNSSLFDRKFDYSITPYFSSGTGTLAGSGNVSYSFQPANSFYRSLDLGISSSYFHYDYDLTYKKFAASANLNFAKNPRSDIRRNLVFSYNFLEKELNEILRAQNDYAKYNLWNLGYAYSDRSLIHEKYLSAGLQWMEDFQKFSTELSYRWEFDRNKKISFRFFGGYFFSNKTKNNLFDYGISRVSNYSFSYGLIGQSATTGLLSQQFILAEGGFKSYIGTPANQWISTVNVDSHVWRWFNVYADAGVYKSKFQDPKFIWDSGVKLKVIPDFLEVYFPIQSTLGFEPSFKDYGKRIRFTLTLNFSAITSYFRRGYF
ncbi:M1 family metallopeptidase [Chryseobacterium sp. SNU WT5]|uniref:M1 family metallopeptidase n=1 Tax=Chryseobacterium sp. SNU WT5 TaxID=2594269 RepID=UPI0011803771|nr:M1 family metallopeptidase [Chryseobacterium sp. SNU WT5]QDP84375.1 M1 family metallopeptidase [Chryseobacterium sp. SNU WT5]